MKIIENQTFDMERALYGCNGVAVRNCSFDGPADGESAFKEGEYLAWYSEGLTLVNCKIIGTQPLCYCKNLKLIDCEMIETDLAFEKSQVEAIVTTPVISIKNPLSGRIFVPEVGEIIMDDENAGGKIIISMQANFPILKQCNCA